MGNIKVSVIVPVYNVERYLPQCLDSLVNQTLEEIEILVINDGSPDNSQAIIDDYAARYPEKIRAFTKENGGLSDARNFGVKHAKGEYIAFVDSDDYVVENMYELLYNKAKNIKTEAELEAEAAAAAAAAAAEIEAEDEDEDEDETDVEAETEAETDVEAEEGPKPDADVVVCNFCKLNGEDLKENIVVKHPLKYFGRSVEEAPNILFESKAFAWNKLFRREWYVENKFEFPVGQWFEDSAVVYGMLYMANYVAAVEGCLYIYRTDRDNSITQASSEKYFDVLKSVASIHYFFYTHTCNKQLLLIADRLALKHAIARLNQVVKTGDRKLKYDFYEAMMDCFDRYLPKWTQNPYYKKSKKPTMYHKYIHVRWFMHLLFLAPNKLVRFAEKVAKRLKRIVTPKKKRKTKKSQRYVNKERLRELQLIELSILKDVDQLCREHGITYYLGEGTLLGAIRHQGFIPWDDDLDIVMPRADYEKFLKLAEGGMLGEKYACVNESNVQKYYLPFSKIVTLEDHGFVNKQDKLGKTLSGPFIDVFPVDFAESAEAKKIGAKHRKIRFMRDLLLLKSGYTKPNTLKRKLAYPLTKFFSFDKLRSNIKAEMTKCGENSAYMCNFASSYHASKQVVSREVYGEPRYVQFEDGLFPVPQKAEELLTAIYGDYMRLPAIRSRVCKHSFYDPISAATRKITQPLEKREIEDLVLEEVRELQLITLGILKEVDRVCRENDIPYYLGEGTLLGAIRHQGFIPWDDDVDILMKREDLIRFMQIADEKLKPNFKLQYYHNIKSYWVLSPKVRLLDKTKFVQPKLTKYTPHNGPYIDIFPLDYTSEKFSNTVKQDRIIKRCRRYLFLKTKYSPPRSWKQRLMLFYSKFFSVKHFHETVIKTATKYSGESKKYLSNFGSYYAIAKETYPAEAFGTPKYVKFEDAEFPVPSDAHYILTRTYGDYMQLPPESKRIGKHSFE